MFNKHQVYLSSDINEGDCWKSKMSSCADWLRYRIVIVPICCAVFYYYRHSKTPERLFSGSTVRDTAAFRRWILQKYEIHFVKELNSWMPIKGQVWQSDEIVGNYKIWKLHHYLESKVIFLAKKSGHGQTYTLQLLQQCAESKGHIVLITSTIGIAASPYRNGCTLHSLLGLGVNDKYSSDATDPNSSK